MRGETVLNFILFLPIDLLTVEKFILFCREKNPIISLNAICCLDVYCFLSIKQQRVQPPRTVRNETLHQFACHPYTGAMLTSVLFHF